MQRTVTRDATPMVPSALLLLLLLLLMLLALMEEEKEEEEEKQEEGVYRMSAVEEDDFDVDVEDGFDGGRFLNADNYVAYAVFRSNCIIVSFYPKCIGKPVKGKLVARASMFGERERVHANVSDASKIPGMRVPCPLPETFLRFPGS
ncbi:hypothetical protein HZH68_001388 [Vespula germanica]|uniref:Uncharacterized protein n=1 Tax=Vespula germanica TaxID=30212 RepID=A0A834NVC9_VESGE|nr:hypothetical protein HZH68_001388 [Vespula germanica]